MVELALSHLLPDPLRGTPVVVPGEAFQQMVRHKVVALPSTQTDSTAQVPVVVVVAAVVALPMRRRGLGPTVLWLCRMPRHAR